MADLVAHGNEEEGLNRIKREEGWGRHQERGA